MYDFEVTSRFKTTFTYNIVALVLDINHAPWCMVQNQKFCFLVKHFKEQRGGYFECQIANLVSSWVLVASYNLSKQ